MPFPTSPEGWFLLALLVCIAGTYLIRARPATARDWAWIRLTLAFAIWVLLAMAGLRSA